MNIKVIGVFRFAIEDAINMLVRLEGKSYALPSIREFEEIEQRLSSTSPYDVVASILADNDYMSHKQIYMDAFGGVLDCEAFIGVVKADGRVVHYWDGLTEKLDASPDIDRVLYIEKVEKVNGLAQENIRGMKADLTKTFGIDQDIQSVLEFQQREPGQAEKILTINDTDREREVFGNALKKQYMTLHNGSYKWVLSKSLLAYMCGRLYCGDRIREDTNDYNSKYIKGSNQMPAREVKALFGVDVASNRYSIKTPPRNSWKVDELFKRNGASK